MTTKKSLEERSKYYKEVELEKLVSLMIMFSFDSEVFKFGVEEPQENVRSWNIVLREVRDIEIESLAWGIKFDEVVREVKELKAWTIC